MYFQQNFNSNQQLGMSVSFDFCFFSIEFYTYAIIILCVIYRKDNAEKLMRRLSVVLLLLLFSMHDVSLGIVLSVRICTRRFYFFLIKFFSFAITYIKLSIISFSSVGIGFLFLLIFYFCAILFLDDFHVNFIDCTPN